MMMMMIMYVGRPN